MKNVGVPDTPLSSALTTSRAMRGAYWRWWTSSAKRSMSRPELLCVAADVHGQQLVLMAEQGVVHVPEASLRARGLGRLGRHLRARVDVAERQMAPDVSELVSEGVQQLADDRLGLAAVGALVVAVLDQHHRGVMAAAEMVDIGVDVVGEVEQLLGGAAQLARARGGGDQRDGAKGRPCRER